MNEATIMQQLKDFLKKEYKAGDVVISYKESGTPGVMTPVFIQSADKIENISINSFCVNNLAVYLSEFFQSEYFEIKQKGRIIITVKPCDAKSVVQMISDAQIPQEKILLIVYECKGITTPKLIKEKIQKEFINIELKNDMYNITLQDKQQISVSEDDVKPNKCKELTHCDLPTFYDYYYIGNDTVSPKDKKAKADPEAPYLQDTLSKSELKKIVESELEKCIRCYACRNICPACFCSDRCIIDKPKLAVPFLEKNVSLENNILFHLIRFNHVAPNCTGCGECERVCPQDIKLSIFYRYFNRLVKKEFGFEAGKSDIERQELLNYRFGEELV